jgi:hypothetical protein
MNPSPTIPALTKLWYVSFPAKGRKHYRMTETFQTESDAKLFALQNLG